MTSAVFKSFNIAQVSKKNSAIKYSDLARAIIIVLADSLFLLKILITQTDELVKFMVLYLYLDLSQISPEILLDGNFHPRSVIECSQKHHL